MGSALLIESSSTGGIRMRHGGQGEAVRAPLVGAVSAAGAAAALLLVAVGRVPVFFAFAVAVVPVRVVLVPLVALPLPGLRSRSC